MTLLLPFGPLHGVNGKLVRNAAALIVDMDSAELYDFAASLGVSLNVAEPIWRRFIEDGYITKNADGRLVPTRRMEDLRTARFGRPLTQKKAEALLLQTIRKAEMTNSEPASSELYYVTKLAVFGSFLDESKHELGDLDIAYELEMRPGTKQSRLYLSMSKDPVAPTRGRILPSPLVRLAAMDIVLLLGCPYHVVYEFRNEFIDQARADRAGVLGYRLPTNAQKRKREE